MSIVLQSTSGGSVTINEPTTASNFTQTLPASTGTVMVSGNMPAFSAYKSTGAGTQTITAGTFGKITFDTEEFDTNNNFASSRFTPTVAGYYQINAEADIGGSGFIVMDLYKNGSNYKRSSGSSGTEVYAVVSTIVYLNGSTDYVEVYGYSTAANASVYGSAGVYTYFNGCLLRAT